jgi:hypothetical protein
MNKQELSESELIQLETLVDGELPEPYYSSLLSRLDETADGWKRCALTFLEHQAVAWELQSYTRSKLSKSMTEVAIPEFDSIQEPVPTQARWNRETLPKRDEYLKPPATVQTLPQPSTVQATTATTSLHKSFGYLLILAASIAIAFSSGFMTSLWRAQPSENWQENIAKNFPAKMDSLDSALADVEQALAAQSSNEDFAHNQISDIETPIGAAPARTGQLDHSPVRYIDPRDSSLLESKEKKIVRLNSLVDAEMERVQSFVPYTREDGQELVVPVQNLKFRPFAVHGF